MPTVPNQPLRGPFYAQQGKSAPDPLEGRTAAPRPKLGTLAKELALVSLPTGSKPAWGKGPEWELSE